MRWSPLLLLLMLVRIGPCSGVASMVGCFLIVRWRTWQAFFLAFFLVWTGEVAAC